MNRRLFLLGLGAGVLASGAAFPTRGQGVTDADMKQARKTLDSMKADGIPLDRFRFPDPETLTAEDRERLKRYRVIKIKDWRAMNAEAKQQAIANLTEANPDYFVCLPDGNIYAIADDDDFYDKVTNYELMPAGLLTEAEFEELDRLRQAPSGSSSSSNTSQPPEKPGGGGGGD
jgi:hypothetical protein